MSSRMYKICYCREHDQGYCLENTCDKSEEEIAKAVCGVDNCVGAHNYEHGVLTCDEQTTTFVFNLTHPQYIYDRYCGGWKIKYFKREIYDAELNNITINDSDTIIYRH